MSMCACIGLCVHVCMVYLCGIFVSLCRGYAQLCLFTRSVQFSHDCLDVCLCVVCTCVYGVYLSVMVSPVCGVCLCVVCACVWCVPVCV